MGVVLVGRTAYDLIGSADREIQNGDVGMVRFGRRGAVIATFVSVAAGGIAPAAAAQTERYHPPVSELEDYVRTPLPPGFSVQRTDVDGPVFVDADGLTLYDWPLNTLRNGQAGEQKGGKPVCDDIRQTVNTGLMSPYPPGLLLPDLDTRPTCTQMWPPVVAAADAKAVGEWGLVDRADGRRQWTFEGFPVYRSALDAKPGQVNGGSRRGGRGDAGSHREPIGPAPNAPPQFAVRTVASGRLLSTDTGFSVYAWDGDRPNTSNCKEACLKAWTPVAAGQSARPKGEWGVIERLPGVKQWTFRGQPLYTHIADSRSHSLEGADVPGWHNVYTQKNPAIPAAFTLQDTRVGQAVADKNGKTIYLYRCGDDALDQLDCDHPVTTQAYRMAVCGKGDPDTCNATFPYVPAAAGAKTASLIWGTMYIDPKTGHPASPDQPGALHVWTFRDRPVYTHGLDLAPGDINGDGWGEYNGKRNGFKGFFLRDDFLGNAG
jgi:predicted lipoprotein with Yx(FWY)xxD motif